MAHELTRLRHEIMSQPQLITATAMAGVLEVLNDRNAVGDMVKLKQVEENYASQLIAEGKPEMALKLKQKGEVTNTPTLSDNGTIAQIDIMGPLTHRATMFEGLCGGMSYQTIVQNVTAAASIDSVENIVLNIDSGGGEAAGAFDAARAIRKIAHDSGKKLTVFSDGMIASAAYALASAADEVVVSESASVGSIGVIMTLQNVKEKLDAEGVKVVPVFAGKNKAIGHPALDLSEEDLAIVQSRVDALFGMFAELVSDMRGISLEAISDMEASVFLGQEAMEKGLADKIMSASEFLESIGEDSMALDVTGVKSSTVTLQESTVTEKTELQDVVSNGVDAEAFAALTAQVAEMTAAMGEKDATIEAANALLKEKAEAERNTQMTAYTEQAKAWSAFSVDAEAFAGLAMDADAALVEMFSTAMDAALTNSKASAAMEEKGSDGEGEGKLSDAERLQAKMKEKYAK